MRDFLLGAACATLVLLGMGQFNATPFMRWDPGNQSVNIYNPYGTLQLQVRNGYIIPPTCPSDVSGMEYGFCKDIATGRLKYRDVGGVKELP